jgi:branched-chain amino acid transport system substrate-binding protein
VHSLFILARNDLPSREPAERLRELALGLGLRVSEVQVYGAGASDFSALATQARADGAQAWIAFGTAREAAEMVKTLRRVGYAPPLFVAQGGSQAAFIQAIGQDAEYALGISPYEARLATLHNAEFVHAYRSRWAALPGLAAAQGYAAGKLIEAAVARTGSFDQERLRAAFAALDTETPLGRYKADPATGAQMAAKPVLTQILEGRIEIVWPVEHATARRQLPYPSWDSRKLMHPALQ